MPSTRAIPRPSPRVIVVASSKGGAGKTTLTTHLAVEAERAGAGPVGVVDTDSKLGLSRWWDARAASSPTLARAKPDLVTAIRALHGSGCKLVIVDTPPQPFGNVSAVIELADLVLVPVQPSPHDLGAIGVTVQMIQRQRKPMVFILNRTKPRVRLTGEAAINLSQYGTVAPIQVSDRAAYAGAKIDGRTAPELDPDGLAAVEMAALWTYVTLRLHEIQSLEKSASLATMAEGSAGHVRKGDAGAVPNAALLPLVAEVARPRQPEPASPGEPPSSRAGYIPRPSLSPFCYGVFEERKRRAGTGTVQVGLNITPELHHRLRLMAFQLCVPVQAIIEMTLIRFMNEYESWGGDS